jgi:hypothetical protein
VNIPQEYTVTKFYQYAGYARYKKISNIYEGGCPICREGRSWGKKRRLYYVVNDNAICCHNCGWYSQPLKWLLEVTDLSYNDIISEIKVNDYEYDIINTSPDTNYKPEFITEDLPKDSINLFDSHQLRYYKNNQVLKKCLDVIASRRLDTAINKPKSLWLSLTDFVHKNRIIIPFYDEESNIVHYQSRQVLDNDDKPKYLSKINSTKSIFNINRVDKELDDLFIFEGPIDSFFVKNGVAVAGIQENSDNVFSTLQSEQLNKLWVFNKIWVLDSQWLDTASYLKTKKLLDQNETVFIWPENIGKKFKDFNDMAVRFSLDSIDHKFVANNSYKGLKGKLLFSKIKPHSR